MNSEAFNLIKGSLPEKRQAPPAMSQSEPTGEEMEALLTERITAETELAPMEPLMRMFGVPCFYRGELVADCGKAKSGKTFFLSVLTAAALTDKVLAVERYTKGAPLKVLWIDTEQSKQSTQEILRDRIVPLCQRELPEGEEMPDINAQLFSFNLRGYGYERRSRMVEVAIRGILPDMAIIDGIKDMMTDINDAVQATLIMEKLMALAQATNCCIVCVLHQNKSQQDHNMRGSIGTELTNKAFEVFQCDCIEAKGVMKVSQTFSRKERMKQNLYYRIDEQALPVECADFEEQPRNVFGQFTVRQENGGNREVDISSVDLRKLFTNAMEGYQQRPFSVVMAVALKKCGVADKSTYYAYVKEAESQEIIVTGKHPDTHETWVKLVETSLPF